MKLSSPNINIFPEMELSNCRLKKVLCFFKKTFSYISGGTCKASKTKFFYYSPKKIMNNFF